jgi:hypothetical protein
MASLDQSVPGNFVPRPALAPADPAVLDKVKQWALAALGM